VIHFDNTSLQISKDRKLINENEAHRSEQSLYFSDLVLMNFYLNEYFKDKPKDNLYLDSETLLSKIQKILSKIT
jgi:hypothetical protein